MEITRDSVVQWLESIRYSQTWLADKCEVSKQAVSNWLREKNPQPISAAAKIKIRSLMDEHVASQKAKPPHNLVLEFLDAEYEPIEQIALRSGKTVREWAKMALNQAASLDVDRFVAELQSDESSVVQFTPKPHLIAAAGSPINGEVMDWDGKDAVVSVKISGLSMSPKFEDGDIIEMRHKKDSRNPYMKKGLIYLVQYDDGYTVKRYNTRKATKEEKGEEWVENGRVKILESINPEHPEIIITQPLEWIAWYDEQKKK